jgi:hypothetical protein
MDKPSGSIPQQVQQSATKDGLTDELRGLLQQAGIISNKKSNRGDVPLKVADKNSSSNAGVTPKQPTEDDPINKTLDDPIDKAGHAVMTVLKKAAGISNEEYERATALADDLANKLRTTERRIKELEAEASSFRDRAVRAEEWMQRISHEIESKFISPKGPLPKTASGSSNQDR